MMNFPINIRSKSRLLPFPPIWFNPCDYSLIPWMSERYDSISISILLGFVFIGLFKFIKLNPAHEKPTKMQNFVEMCVEFVNENILSVFGPTKNKLIGPLSLTVLVWVFFLPGAFTYLFFLFPFVMSFCAYLFI